MTRNALCICILFLALLPALTRAQETNAGFVQGLWYSSQHIFAGKPVRIYVAVRNDTGSDLAGTVTFLDGSTTIGTQKVQALDGRIVETWADWSPNYGTHTISANLSHIQLSHVGSSTQSVTISSNLAQDSFFVDYDTDNDGIGNGVDTDDDADGIPDTQEVANGTNPLVPDAPKPSSTPAVSQATAPSTSNEQYSSTHATTASEASSSSAGIEQFLPQGPAKEVLTSVSNLITQTKENLDVYRTNREEHLYDAAHPQSFPVDAQGFGPIIRSKTSDPTKVQLPQLQGNNALDKVKNAGKMLLSAAYSWTLAGASFTLGHPMFVEILGMILILLILIRLAAKFGGRRRNI